MKNRMPVDVGVVLVAGLTMAGCTPGAMTLAGLSAPVAGASAPVAALSAPAVQAVADRSAPVAAYSAPAYCLDFTTANGRMTVGDASAPQCVVVNTVPAADHSAPVAAASVPQCVGIVTPRSTCGGAEPAQRPPSRPRPSRSRIMPSSRPSLPRSRKRSSTAISRL